MLHGNLYKMRDGLYMATLYNQLPHDGIRLDGHYTILFTVPDYKIYCYKHGDYANLVSYIPQGFCGFIELNAKELEYLQDMAKNTMERKPHLYDYTLHGNPSYLAAIPLTDNNNSMRCQFKYNDGGRAQAGYKGNAGDCVARSIAIATGKPYAEIYDALANGNANQRITKKTKRSKKSMRKAGVHTASMGIHTTRQWFKNYMRSLGFEWIACMGIGTGCKVHLRVSELPMGRLVVNVSKHSVAVIDGVIHDTYDPSREGDRCVYGYWILNR